MEDPEYRHIQRAWLGRYAQDDGIAGSNIGNPSDWQSQNNDSVDANVAREAEPDDDSDVSEFIDDGSGDEGFDELSDLGSDADSDTREHHKVLKKLKNSIVDLKDPFNPDGALVVPFDPFEGGDDQEDQTGRRGTGRPSGPGTGIRKGPRKAAPMTADVKIRMALATEAFIQENYREASIHTLEVIRLNAETYQAWTLLASIFQENGDTSSAAKSLVYAAHLRPKHLRPWMMAAKFALEETGSQRKKFLPTASFCYSGAVRADPKSIEARLGKATVYTLRNNPSRAMTEYDFILTKEPHDRRLLRLLAEVSLEHGDVKVALEHYEKSIAHFQGSSDELGVTFDWTDADTYVTLLEYADQYEAVIRAVKSLARWLLGREDETFWDNVTEDDREWDTVDSRRLATPMFSLGKHLPSTYGEGLPLEFRVKLGLARLHLGHYEEAMGHLAFLDPLNERGEQRVQDYPHLFRQVADLMANTYRYQQALIFYQPLRQNPKNVDSAMLVQMGKCFMVLKDEEMAIQFFVEAVRSNSGEIEGRMELARLHERRNEQAEAFDYVNEVMLLKRGQQHSSLRKVMKKSKNHIPGAESFLAPDTGTKGRVQGLQTKKIEKEKSMTEKFIYEEQLARARFLQKEYQTLLKSRPGMRKGDLASTNAWMEAAGCLTDDFRSFKAFYPWDKYLKFLGYSSETRVEAEAALDVDLSAMAERLSKGLGADIARNNVPGIKVPEDYRGLSFPTWLDLFLDQALCLAQRGKQKEAYELCEAAKDAIVFYHSREDMFLIHVCFSMCALVSNDEETLIAAARFFAKDYQFTTDSYRMMSALSRMCHSPVSWYNAGPNQKFILRQIKLMDFTLADPENKKKWYGEKGSYSATDEKGHLIINTDMDISLLMLYGHILYAGASYTYALNYFYRAYALDPTSPIINLNIGLAYISDCLKRQTENRQFSILQGTTFMLAYYESRKNASHVEERQEAHYNMARMYHMLGVNHLAIPYYQKVLDEITDETPRSTREDIIIDTAYNLQNMYAIVGNMELARQITRRWLVI